MVLACVYSALALLTARPVCKYPQLPIGYASCERGSETELHMVSVWDMPYPALH